ncbi:MAG: 50S ribosomal protein L3 [Candidatus Eremiobacteraeota bacterium]|nr:50S ribosomal protein L3 [Candidatus Eremiobacteraeota bacterium]MBC5828296.1 50S ribosomal protein L3 [Candidatus Eremiobacteraeota bacterium]
MKQIIGRKLGMTNIFTDDGRSVPVTVIEAGPCSVVERRSADRHGYEAVVLGFEDAKIKQLTKPMRGRFEKLNTAPKSVLREFRGASEDVKAGDVVTVAGFAGGDRIDVIGTSKGKGFSGIIKRWNGSGGGASHGSMIHRQPASNGDTNAAKTVKGSRRPGLLGRDRVTTLNLEVVRTDDERNLLMIKGAVPGPRDGIVMVRSRIKGGRP